MTTTKITNEKFPVRVGTDDLNELVHGADFNWSFQLFEDDNTTPLDVTGWECDIYLLESENGEEYAHYSSGSGVTITEASGLFSLDIASTDVDALDFKNCIFKVIVTDDTPIKLCYFLGKLQFAQV